MATVDKKTLILGIVLLLFILVSMSVTFYRYMILRDYEVIIDPEEAPDLNIANPE